MHTEPQIYFQREAGGWNTTAALLLEVRRWLSWDLPPFCPALEVCKGLFQDARNRKLIYGGVPRTLGSAEKREQGLSWKGQQSSDPLK